MADADWAPPVGFVAHWNRAPAAVRRALLCALHCDRHRSGAAQRTIFGDSVVRIVAFLPEGAVLYRARRDFRRALHSSPASGAEEVGLLDATTGDRIWVSATRVLQSVSYMCPIAGAAPPPGHIEWEDVGSLWAQLAEHEGAWMLVSRREDEGPPVVSQEDSWGLRAAPAPRGSAAWCAMRDSLLRACGILPNKPSLAALRELTTSPAFTGCIDDYCDDNDSSPLAYCVGPAAADSCEMVRYMVRELGADVRRRNNKRLSALDYARNWQLGTGSESLQREVVALLEELAAQGGGARTDCPAQPRDGARD